MFDHAPGATASVFAGNLLFVGLGNLVGGGLLIGAGYGLLGRTSHPKRRIDGSDHAVSDRLEPVAG
jgi:nitrite transporter NirC